MKSRALLATLLNLALVLGLASVPLAQTRAPVKVPILISPLGSGPYTAWAMVQQKAAQWHPWLRPIAVETGGFTYNVVYMGKSAKNWKTHVFGSGSVAHWAAGLPWKPYFPERVPPEDFKVLGYMGVTANFFVTLDPKIKTPKDFKGKRIGVGLRTQNEWGMHPTMMLEVWGIKEKLAALDHLGTKANTDALLDGRTDVGFVFVPFDEEKNNILITPPHRNLQASGRKFYYVNVPPEMIEEFNKKTQAPFMVARFEPNQLPMQPEPVTTFGDLLPLMAHKSFPEDIAYEFVKFWVDMAPKLAKLHAFGKLWTPKTLALGAKAHPELFHPGALRAYRELGLVK